MKKAFLSVGRRIDKANIYPQLCLCRKYHKKGKVAYIFLRADISTGVAEELKKWLIANINKIKEQDISTYPENNPGEIYFMNLDNIENWKIFNKNAFSLENQEILQDLKKIKRNLDHYIIYIQMDDVLVGMIRRLKPKHVIERSGRFALFFDDKAFNSIKEVKGLELDQECDFLFLKSKDKKICLVVDEKNFDSIFDLYMQEMDKTIESIEDSSIYNHIQDKQRFMEIVREDSNIQRLMMKSVSQIGISEVTMNDLRNIKNTLKGKVRFKVGKQNIEFPPQYEKEAIKDFLKSVGHCYTKAFFRNYVIEGVPIRILQ